MNHTRNKVSSYEDKNEVEQPFDLKHQLILDDTERFEDVSYLIYQRNARFFQMLRGEELELSTTLSNNQLDSATLSSSSFYRDKKSSGNDIKVEDMSDTSSSNFSLEHRSKTLKSHISSSRPPNEIESKVCTVL